MTTVRLFASLRDAAGAGRLETDAPTVAALLEELGRRYGDVMRARLARVTVVVDGEPVSADDPRPVGAASEVVLLPPFSGGSR